MTKPHIAVVGAGIVGICSAYFLNKSGFQVTLIDQNDPGSMTSYGHACTFADYACIPVNSPDLFKDILTAGKSKVDPNGIMNPGVLIDPENKIIDNWLK